MRGTYLRAGGHVALISFALIAPLATAGDLGGVTSVIDGDTIEFHGQRIRLHGIDAPESSQQCERPSGKRWRCGQQAALALSDRLGRRTVSCEARDIDRYGRVVAVCYESGEDINGWLVRQGWAVAYRRYSTAYVAAEEYAKADGVGIWSSDFVMPWEWRRGVRLADPLKPTLLKQSVGTPLPFTVNGPDRDCGDFDSWESAQAFYEAAGGPAHDAHRLDGDQDGIACEGLR